MDNRPVLLLIGNSTDAETEEHDIIDKINGHKIRRRLDNNMDALPVITSRGL